METSRSEECYHETQEKQRWGCKNRKKKAAFIARHCKFSANHKFTHKHNLYTIKNPLNVNCSRLEDENSVVGEMLAQGLVLWQWLKPWNHVYRHMLIIYVLSHSQVSTLASLQNAKPTRGDVFTARTNSIYAAAGHSWDLKWTVKFTRCYQRGAVVWLVDLNSVNTRAPLTKVVLLLVSYIHITDLKYKHCLIKQWHERPGDTENDVQMKRDYFYRFPFGICYLADWVHFKRLQSVSAFLFLKFWVQHKDMGKISPTGGLLSHFWELLHPQTHKINHRR